MDNLRVWTVVGVLAVAAVAGLAPALMPSQPIAEVSTPLADHPIAKMVGYWRGTASRIGRTDMQWHAATGVERARWNLAGTAILVEGYGYIDDPDTGERRVGHDAFGLIEWDDAEGKPVFYARRAGGQFETYEIEVVEGTGQVRWFMTPAPDVRLRFTITLTDTRWHEVGEMSRDEGQTWMKMLETDLTRVRE